MIAYYIGLKVLYCFPSVIDAQIPHRVSLNLSECKTNFGAGCLKEFWTSTLCLANGLVTRGTTLKKLEKQMMSQMRLNTFNYRTKSRFAAQNTFSRVSNITDLSWKEALHRIQDPRRPRKAEVDPIRLVCKFIFHSLCLAHKENNSRKLQKKLAF